MSIGPWKIGVGRIKVKYWQNILGGGPSSALHTNDFKQPSYKQGSNDIQSVLIRKGETSNQSLYSDRLNYM